MTAIDGAAVLVTGAANGIGKSLATALARRGCDVALADRDEAGIRALGQQLQASGARGKITHTRVDIANPSEIEAMAATVLSAHPALNIVVNNAGVALFGQFHETSPADMEWLMGINFWGVVNVTRAFLPHLEKQPAGHIANLSSIFGIVAPPGQTAYSAAKFAVRGFSEALRHELAMRNSRVHLSVVHPGGIATGIARSARVGAFMTDNARRAESIDRFEAIAKTTPDEAARVIIDGIEANKARILIGSDARRLDIVQRLFPGTYWARVQKQLEKSIARLQKGSSA